MSGLRFRAYQRLIRCESVVSQDNWRMPAMIQALLASTINIIPLTYSSPAPLPSPPPLTDSSTSCQSVEPAIPRDPTAIALVAHVDTSSTTAYFVGLLTKFSPNGNVNGTSSGFLYLRLDRGPQQFLAVRPSGRDAGADLLVAFTGLTEGEHVIDFGITSIAAGALPFGRICFNVHAGKRARFQFVY